MLLKKVLQPTFLLDFSQTPHEAVLREDASHTNSLYQKEAKFLEKVCVALF